MAKRNTKANYISGNVLRQEELIYEMQQPYVVKNKKKKKNKLNPGMVLFLSLSIGIMMMVLMAAVSARAEYTASVKRVSQKEAELNNIRLSNDEELERIDASLNLVEFVVSHSSVVYLAL